MDLKAAQQGVIHAWYWKPSQLLKASEVTDLAGKHSTTTLLNPHNPYLQSNFVLIPTDKGSSNPSS